MLRILLVSDNGELISLIKRALAGGELELVGVAQSQADAVEGARRRKPDLIIVEPRMGLLDGISVVREIMVEAPAPIVIVAGKGDPDLGIGGADALASGALAIIPAPLESGGKLEENSTRKFLSSLTAMSQVKVVRRWRGRSERQGPHPKIVLQPSVRVVGIAASTGGPAAIKTILKSLPPDFPAPILVVQHISDGYINGVASSLDKALPLRVKVAENGDPLSPATVYFAPDRHQMGLRGKTRIAVADDPPVDGFRPSGTYLFESMAQAFGSQALAVVLTGMGRDGTEGLRSIRAANGLVIAQDAESSVVFGMPKAAIDSGLVDLVLPLEQIAGEIARLAGASKS